MGMGISRSTVRAQVQTNTLQTMYTIKLCLTIVLL